jgi:putative transposase
MPDKKRTKKSKNNQSAFITLVEKHIIRRDDPRFEKIDQASFKSKNLYNLCNYYIRQAYIHENRYLQLNEAYKKLKGSDAYVALPRKVSNQVILQVYHDWGAYYEAMKVWRVAKDKFLGKPKIPKYKDKQKRAWAFGLRERSS